MRTIAIQSDISVRNEGTFWGLRVHSFTLNADKFSKTYFKGISKKNYYIPHKDIEYFISVALSSGLTIETLPTLND